MESQKLPPDPPFLQAKPPHFLQRLLVLQTLPQFYSLPWTRCSTSMSHCEGRTSDPRTGGAPEVTAQRDHHCSGHFSGWWGHPAKGQTNGQGLCDRADATLSLPALWIHLLLGLLLTSSSPGRNPIWPPQCHLKAGICFQPHPCSRQWRGLSGSVAPRKTSAGFLAPRELHSEKHLDNHGGGLTLWDPPCQVARGKSVREMW